MKNNHSICEILYVTKNSKALCMSKNRPSTFFKHRINISKSLEKIMLSSV